MWQDYAACAADDEDPDCWDYSVASPAQRVHAVAVCASCPVAGQCLDNAQRRPPVDMIQAGFRWTYPSLEPRNAVTGKLLRQRKRRTRAA